MRWRHARHSCFAAALLFLGCGHRCPNAPRECGAPTCDVESDADGLWRRADGDDGQSFYFDGCRVYWRFLVDMGSSRSSSCAVHSRATGLVGMPTFQASAAELAFGGCWSRAWRFEFSGGTGTLDRGDGVRDSYERVDPCDWTSAERSLAESCNAGVVEGTPPWLSRLLVAVDRTMDP